MSREDWSDPGFWGWWWRNRVSAEVKVGLAAAAVLLLAVVGYGVAYGMSDAETANTRLVRTTVSKVVTIRSQGRTQRRTVPVVRTVPAAAGSTGVQQEVILETVTEPGGERVVARTVERRVVVAGAVRTVGGGTVVDQRTVTDRRTVTDQRTVTDERTVTDVRTVVDVQTVTAPPVTRVVTETVTQTVPVTVAVTFTFPTGPP